MEPHPAAQPPAIPDQATTDVIRASTARASRVFLTGGTPPHEKDGIIKSRFFTGVPNHAKSMYLSQRRILNEYRSSWTRQLAMCSRSR